MAIRRTLAQFSDEIVAADLADNSVTTAKIADSQITAAKVAADVATQAELNVVSTAVDNVDVSTEMLPHIRPGVLYPAVANIMVDGSTALSAVTTGPNSSTVPSSKYGTVQSDGRMYYYTDIKGSQPIKDPRIGSHFGSQRHKFKSLQLLEQETATHGNDVFSIDGREWLRAVNSATSGWITDNAANGNYIKGSGSNCSDIYLEIVGYFNNFTIINGTGGDSADDIDLIVDGGSPTANTTIGGRATVGSPLSNRYVDRGGLAQGISLGTTPQIHTLKFLVTNGSSEYIFLYGIELIAQDTTSATTRNQIQIPSQNVVSYGKKFTVAAETKHYNPFAFKTDGSTAWASGAHNGTAWPIGTGSSTNIDTATSLGLAAWVSTNYYYPYNGGRVVKWIASDGTIKTSVNMMPPNARSILTTAISAKANATIANNTYLPTFEAGAIDHSLAEVAKTFHWREFGNGSANQGHGGSFADASMMGATSPDDLAYVMDDGLTSLAIDDAEYQAAHEVAMLTTANDFICITFIGTGVSTYSNYWGTGWNHIAQNLPYGTHILKITRDGDIDPDIAIDGVALNDVDINTHGNFQEVTFHQPKMPPIPEDAVVIADYMLMADHVVKGAQGTDKISKGIRLLSSTRDVFYDGAGAFVLQMDVNDQTGFQTYRDTESTVLSRLPSFSTNVAKVTYDAENRYQAWYTNDTGHSSAVTTTKTGTTYGSIYYPASATTLGMNIHEQYGAKLGSGGNALITNAYEIVSPIHTSSHYQTFETPFLHELVGGDRNMEQTNLVVTPDGKTWDEITRDVSYIGNTVVSLASSTGDNALATVTILDDARGKVMTHLNLGVKDSWVLAYDRVLCLKDGEYRVEVPVLSATSVGVALKLNGAGIASINGTSGQRDGKTLTFSNYFKRGDYVQVFGGYWPNAEMSQFRIYKEKY